MPYADPFTTATDNGTGMSPEQYKNYYLNNTPEAGFWSYLQNRGLVGNSGAQRYAQGQYGRLYGEFQASAADNPNEGFYDYVSRMKPDFQTDYMAQSPDQRGDFTSRTQTGKARFVKAY